MASRQEDVIALVGVLVGMDSKKRRKRRTWCKNWLKNRNEYTHTKLLNELCSDPWDYRNYLRMSEEVYNTLLSLVTPLIQKKNTVMRTSISPHERLAATLRLLATGRTYECMKYSTIISPQALGKIIPETCEAINTVLKKGYLQVCKVKPRLNIL